MGGKAKFIKTGEVSDDDNNNVVVYSNLLGSVPYRLLDVSYF